MNRRAILKGLLATSAVSLSGRRVLAGMLDLAPGQQMLPLPSFSDSSVVRSVAGLRPTRGAGVRIEVERQKTVLGKTIIHNYGHGGAGFTMSWGSAIEAANLVTSPEGKQIAILGAGVIGLSTAIILAERGAHVTVYTSATTPHTTSDVAGAQWSPAFTNGGNTVEEQARYFRILANTYKRFGLMVGARYAVSLKPNYIADGFKDGLQTVPDGILESPQRVERLPFSGATMGGTVFNSWLIEPPIYMPALMADVRARGGTIQKKSFDSLADIAGLSESIVDNCTGLGSAKLFDDSDLTPLKGQLVHLKPDTRMGYILLHHHGYLFCRNDVIVLGGSYEKGNFDATPDPAVTQKILTWHREFFTKG